MLLFAVTAATRLEANTVKARECIIIKKDR